ncbi:unnamed protein product [Moneuplotes crassus]|uniref:Uncharacterized protein n=1 Tax=Euplotes crassus TaxID=5936 RepID=A0AAD1U6R5_EUPCR|nr:unnamed protein product [Moneuplotes crassus]
MKERLNGLGDVFTNISSVVNVLPYYSYPDIIHNLMMQFSKRSRGLWKKDIYKWSRLFSEYKDCMSLMSPLDLVPIAEFSPEMFLKFQLRVALHSKDLDVLTKFINENPPIEFKRIELNIRRCSRASNFTDQNDPRSPCVYSPAKPNGVESLMNKIKLLCETINKSYEKLGLNRLNIKYHEDSQEDLYKIYSMPSLFEIEQKSILMENVYVLDSKIKVLIKGPLPETSNTEIEIMNPENHMVYTKECLKDCCRISSTKTLFPYEHSQEMDISCWRDVKVSEILKYDLFQPGKALKANFKRICFSFRDVGSILKWNPCIDKIKNLNISCNIKYEQFLDYPEKYFLIVLEKGLFTVTHNTKTLTYHLKTLAIKTPVCPLSSSPGCFQICSNFETFGRLIRIQKGGVGRKGGEIGGKKGVLEFRVEDVSAVIYSGRIFENSTEQQDDPQISFLEKRAKCKIPFQFGMLSLNFKPNPEETPQNMEIFKFIEENIERINLNKLRLFCNYYVDDLIEITQNILSKARNLQTVTISIGTDCEQHRKDIISRLLTSMKSSPKVQSLSLKFTGAKKASDKKWNRLWLPRARVFSYTSV